MPDVGRILGDRYRLVELLGAGGMATIYRAHDSRLDRDVAVKLLQPRYGRDPEFNARFRNEAQAAASLSHPNVVTVYDFGTDDDSPYIVMQLVDGDDVAALLAERGPFPPARAARIAEQVAEALSAAHARGLVHRDVKPSNIMVGRDGRVLVTDFGIARLLVDTQLTLPGTTMGSVHYFSPEQTRGEPVSATTDVYALGLVLFEMLTGRQAYGGDNVAAVAMARLSSPVPPPSSVRPEVPTELDEIVARATELDPADRYASASEMAAVLATYLDGIAAGATAPIAAMGAAGAGVAAAGAAAAAQQKAGAAVEPAIPISTEAEAAVALGVVGGVSATSPPPAAGRPPSLGTAAGTSSRAGGSRVTGGAGVTEGPGVGPGGGPDGGAGRGAGNGPTGGPAEVGPWAWAAGILGLLVLVITAGAIYLVLTRGFATHSPAPSNVLAPNFVGMTLTAAQQQATAAGLVVQVGDTQQSSDRPDGTIVAQAPPEGTEVSPGSVVKVTVVTAKPVVAVPDLRGMREAQAAVALNNAKLQPGQRSEGYDSAIPAGAVISQNPAAGIEVAVGTSVDYVVSQGPSPSPSLTPSPSPSPTPPPTAPPPPPPTEIPTLPPPPPTEVPTLQPTSVPLPTLPPSAPPSPAPS